MKDINLLPQDMKDTTAYAETGQKTGITPATIVIALLVLVVFAATLFIPKAYIKSLEMDLKTLETEIKSEKYAEVKKVTKDLQIINNTLSSKTLIIADIDNTNISVNELIAAVKGATPEGAELYAVTLNRQKIKIDGMAPDNIIVAEMVSNLARLRNIRMTGSADIRDDNTFTIDMSIIGKAGV
ncbi:MAG: hypothetical protein GX992_09515 [Clostridium sp.]|nr:hypothetical protein [Clostridium sp.]